MILYGNGKFLVICNLAISKWLLHFFHLSEAPSIYQTNFCHLPTKIKREFFSSFHRFKVGNAVCIMDLDLGERIKMIILDPLTK